MLAFALVFPGEVVAEPDVGEAGAAAGFADLFFKGIALTGGVGGGRVGLAEEVAEIDELGLGAGSLRLRVDLPAMNEVGDGERHGGKGSLQLGARTRARDCSDEPWGARKWG